MARHGAGEAAKAENKIEPPVELKAPPKPVNVRGQRILKQGTLQTSKQERVQMRIKLAK